MQHPDAAPRRRSRALGTAIRSSALIGVLVVAVGLAIGFAMARSASAQSTLAATLTGPQKGSGVIQLDGLTCDTAAQTLQSAATNGTSPTLPVMPSGFPAVAASSLVVAENPSSSCTTLTLDGTATMFGINADVLVVGQWASATATTPVFTVVFGFQNVNLSQLVSPSSTSLGATFSSAWVAVTNGTVKTTITVADLPQSSRSFLNSDLTVATSGLTFRGVLSSTSELATGLSHLGVSASGIELDGALTSDLSGFTTSAPPGAGTGFDVSASITPSVTTPSWLSLDHALTLGIAGTKSGTWSVTATGNATVTIPDVGPVPTSVSIAIVKGASGVELDLTGSMGTVADAFGQNWFTLDSASIAWTFSPTDTTATLKASATVESTTFDVTATLSASGDASVDVKLSSANSNAVIDAQTLAADVGLSPWPSGLPDVSLGSAEFYLDVPKSGDVTFSATASSTLTVGQAQFNVGMLLREQLGQNGSLLVAAKLQQPQAGPVTVGQLLGVTINPDIPIPNVAVVLSTTNFTSASSALDPPTEKYFAGMLCTQADPTCSYTLDAPAGVGVVASATLPSSFGQMFCTLMGETTGCTDPFTGPVTLTGQIPLFGGKTFSLTLGLPKITVDAGPVQQIGLHLSLSDTNDTVSFAIGGDLAVLAPGTAPQAGAASTCPTGVTPPTGDVCLQVSATGSVSVGPSGASVDLTGSLTGGNGTGWQLPDPVSWLTIDDVTLQIGVTAGDEVGVTLGARGKFLVGSTDLEFSVDLEATPNPPWVNLLGFAAGSKQGLSMNDLSSLFTDVSGQSVPSGVLPPLAVQNLYLSFSQTQDKALCLSPGVYISGDLVLQNQGATPITESLPTGQASDCTTPAPSTACSSDSASCLASVFLSVGPDGIDGKGHLAGFSAGPLTFDPTDLGFELGPSKVQVDISAGAQLEDPTKWSPGHSAPVWAKGNLDLKVGTKALGLSGDVTIGQLTGSISGKGSFDLSDPGFQLTDFFNKAQQAFQTAGTAITSSMDTVAHTADSWYSTYVATSADAAAQDIQNAFGALSTSGPQSWQDVYNLYVSISGTINSVNSALNKVGLNSLDISTNTIFNDVLHGLKFPGAQLCAGKLGCVTIWKGFTIPGLCSYDGNIEGTPVCTTSLSDLVASARTQFGDPSVKNNLGGLSVPPSSSASTVVTQIHTLDPPAASSITCASATEQFSTTSGTGGSESSTSLGVSSLGNPLTISGPAPSTLGNANDATANNQELGQHTLNGLTTGENHGTCLESTLPSTPSVSLSLDRSWIEEGGSVTASGYVSNTTAQSVTVAWGDGSTSNATVTNGAYSASHTYADETAPSATSPFTVEASISDASATGKVTVTEAPISVSSFSASPSPVDVMGSVTASGTVAGYESGESTSATISWGDGTPDSTVVVGTGGAFSAQHVYEALVPPGHPSQVEDIGVTVTEGDAPPATASTTVTVDDVAPTGTTLSATAGAITDSGTVFTHASTATTWASSALDISPKQVLSFDVNWADGTPDAHATVAGPPTGPVAGNYTYTVTPGDLTHTFAQACLYNVQTSVTDDDTLSAPTLTTPVVVTAPLGAGTEGSGYWLEQVNGSFPTNRGGKLSAATIGCYLEIANYLSPELATNLTPDAAVGILKPDYGGLSTVDMTAAQLRSALLTTLMNFANGTWDWTQGIGPNGETYASIVAAANSALTSNSLTAMQSSLAVLKSLY